MSCYPAVVYGRVRLEFGSPALRELALPSAGPTAVAAGDLTAGEAWEEAAAATALLGLLLLLGEKFLQPSWQPQDFQVLAPYHSNRLSSARRGLISINNRKQSSSHRAAIHPAQEAG